MVQSIVSSSSSLLAILAVLLVTFTTTTTAFTTPAAVRNNNNVAFQPASFVSGATPSMAHKQAATSAMMILRMAEKESEEASTKVSADGTFYDDELDSAPVKEGISDTMRQRLINEASTGLDSSKPQTNVILYISIAVAILAVLGGAGIFY